MASVDFHDPRVGVRRTVRGAVHHYATGPQRDLLGQVLLAFHVAVGAFLVLGWLIPYALGLAFYMVLLPVVAVQWLINHGSCVLNNFETWLRHGKWRDPRNREEGNWLAMLAQWLFRWRPNRAALDTLSYATVAGLWILAFAHFSLLPAS